MSEKISLDSSVDIYLHPKLYIHIFVRRNFVMYLFDRGRKIVR